MRKLGDAITRINASMAYFVGTLSALMMIVVVADVAARFVLGGSIQNASEVAVVLLVILIFMAFAGAQAKHLNFRVEVLIRLLPLRLYRIVETITAFLAFGTVSVIAYYSWGQAVKATIDREESYGVVSFPVWPTRLIIAAGLSLLALQLLVQLLQAMPRILHPGHDERQDDAAATMTPVE